jgi:2-octaprenylphenol hydroxylase
MHFDIIIVGNGIVGAAAALALAKNADLQIAVLDSQTEISSWDETQHDHRVSAISLASKKIFQNLNVWKKIQAKRFSPYAKMQVWDEKEECQIYFDARDLNEPALGFIIEDKVMRVSLNEALREQSNIHLFHSVKLSALQIHEDRVELQTQDATVFTAKLLIGADGAHSWVREKMQVAMRTWSYQQTALVATVKTAVPHEAIARQRFLMTGPLAFLPLKDKCSSSIVWSTTPEHANQLLSLEKEAFCEKLSAAFAYKLGEIVATSQRYSFPLQMRHVKNYVIDRCALIGDAAHTLHPLAGQGVNLGLLDAVCLAEEISEAHEKKRNFAHIAVLRRYERKRKSDNLTMLAMVEALKSLFISDKKSWTFLRTTGMNFTDRSSFLKNFLANYAIGNCRDLPRIAL